MISTAHEIDITSINERQVAHINLFLPTLKTKKIQLAIFDMHYLENR